MKHHVRMYLGLLILGLALLCSGRLYKYVWGQGNMTQSSDYAWIVYWDQGSGLKELSKVKGNLAGVSLFAVNYDDKGNFVYPDNWDSFVEKTSKVAHFKKYLTVVNDVSLSDGNQLSKDKDVLKLLLKDEQASAEHAKKLVALAKENKYDGLEIDYEAFWKDLSLVNAYQRFLGQLTTEAAKNNLPVRIILEPSAPFNSFSWPVGPEYVVMLYNLYGNHTKVGGPKADRALIVKTIIAMDALPGEKGVALASGGCIWEAGRNGKLIPEQECVGLLKNLRGIPARDDVSHAVHFKYVKNNVSGECWYADGETLRYWRQIARSLGIRHYYLWRLGHNGNIERLLS